MGIFEEAKNFTIKGKHINIVDDHNPEVEKKNGMWVYTLGLGGGDETEVDLSLEQFVHIFYEYSLSSIKMGKDARKQAKQWLKEYKGK